MSFQESFNKLLRRSRVANSEREKERVRDFMLVEMSKALVESVDNYNQFLDELVEMVAEAMDADRVSLLTRQGDHLKIAAARGLSEEIKRKTRMRLGEGISGIVAASGEPLFIIEGEQVTPGIDELLLGGDAYRSPCFISFPIKARERVLGVLNVTNPRTARNFDSHDMVYLQTIVNVASIFLTRAQAIRELIAVRTTDETTGLGNRTNLKEVFMIEEERSARYGHPVSVVHCAIDGLKEYKKKYGNDFTDVLVRNVGQYIKANSRRVDHVFHVGGGNYITLLPHIPADKARIYARRIRALIREATPVSAREDVKVTVCIGLATMPVDGECYEELLTKAALAMERARSSGADKIASARRPRKRFGVPPRKIVQLQSEFTER